MQPNATSEHTQTHVHTHTYTHTQNNKNDLQDLYNCLKNL
jgi:hypothetical protein